MMNVNGQKIAAIKSLIIQAWRDRWSEMQWSISVKKLLLPNTDNYMLADILLKQALVGSSPNSLLLSYLRHALATQMVTHSAVIRCMVKFEDMEKVYCLRSLLELTHGFAGRLGTRGNYEDSLTLGKSMLLLLNWLLTLTLKSLQHLAENPKMTDYLTVIERACSITLILLEDMAPRALLYIARCDDVEAFREVEQTEVNVRGFLSQMSSDLVPAALLENLNKSVDHIERIRSLMLETQPLLQVSHQPLNISLNVLLTQEAILNPMSDIQSFVEQILVIEKTQGLTRPDLYCEMYRTCLLGLIDATGGQYEIKWAAFAFLKLPQVVVRLIQMDSTRGNSDLELGLERLLMYTPLLNLADTKCTNCDSLNYLIQELSKKYGLLSEAYVERLQQKRQAKSQKPNVVEQQPGSTQGFGLILRAEPTVQSILKTLDADYSKNQEALLGVLCHMLSGKSFELILAAAAATGRLQSFAVKLIKFNEFARQATAEVGKAAQTRGLLFDITFLMLCHIMQLYGTEIISLSQEANGSFFVNWVLYCLPEDGKYKSLELMAPPDSSKVEVLLSQFNPGGELKTNATKWHEVCHNIPYALQEVLLAWEQNAINSEVVKAILDNMKGRMCCLPVVVSAWLCSYINVIDEDVRKKPVHMLQQLMKPVMNVPANNEYYNERSLLMQTILRRMCVGVLPSGTIPITPYVLPANASAYTILIETLKQAFTKGSIDLKTVHKFEHLITVGGTKWFCEHVVREILSHDRVEELNNGVSLVHAIFHMDLENFTITLLHHTVPGLLQSAGSKLALLTDPRGSALAKLCIMCLMVVQALRKVQEDVPNVRRGKKRSRADIEVEEAEEEVEDGRPSKIRRLPMHNLSLHSEGFNFGELLSSKEEVEPLPKYDTKDPLNKTLVNLFRTFTTIISQSNVGQKTGFVMSFVKEAVKCGPDTSRFVLQFMPLNLISQLMKCLPAEFRPELLLSVCDLSSSMGRRIAAKIVAQNAKYHHMKEAKEKDI